MRWHSVQTVHELGQTVTSESTSVINQNIQANLDMYPDAVADSSRQTELRESILMSEGKHKPRADLRPG